MKKWKVQNLDNFLKEDRQNAYWFWKKGRHCISPIWETKRSRDQFYLILDALHIQINMMKGKWNGQSKSEFDKNYKRVKDIIDKSSGDKPTAIKLATTQANRITDEWKAINRAMAAKEKGHEHIFEVFFQRAYELGTVTKQDYREYQLERLGI